MSTIRGLALTISPQYPKCVGVKAKDHCNIYMTQLWRTQAHLGLRSSMHWRLWRWLDRDQYCIVFFSFVATLLRLLITFGWMRRSVTALLIACSAWQHMVSRGAHRYASNISCHHEHIAIDSTWLSTAAVLFPNAATSPVFLLTGQTVARSQHTGAS